MIIKSLSRKSKGKVGSVGKREGGNPFANLARYMNRGIEEEDGKAVLWHNFYGSERTTEAEIISEFEKNAALLRERKNGNVLYHEILSFSAGHKAKGEDVYRMVADVGQEYLRERAPDQLGYGVIHLDTDHIHLHLMISANAAGRSERARLSKSEFAQVQKRVERYVLERYKELAQTPVYDRERPKERLKTDAREQSMKARTGEPSQKERIKARMHQMFHEAASFEELARLAKAAGFSFYQRGQTVGISVAGPDGKERKHRLSTLGVQDHYDATNARLAAERDARGPKKSPEPPPRQDASAGSAPRTLDDEIRDLLAGHRDEAPAQPSRESEAARRERELREAHSKARERDREPGGKDRGDRER